MNAGIFISYRRDDTRQAAGRLGDDLAREFGAERIFRDIERIELGVDFEQALNQALNNCQVMLVLIGRQWSTITDDQGARRLEQPSDWIHVEIATALQRNIRVVPVLVDDAALPLEAALPEDLRPLLRRQAFKIEDARWHSDVQRLVEGLSRMEGLALARRPAAAPAAASVAAATGGMSGGKKIGIGVAVALAIGIALKVAGVFDSGPDDSSPLPEAQAAVDSAAAPNVGGVWLNDADKETYTIKQTGTTLTVAFLQRTGAGAEGSGTLNGRTVVFTVTFDPAEGSKKGIPMDCKMELAEDSLALRGNCLNGGENYPVTLTRG